MRQPWDRWTGEPSKAYAVFLVYRDLGPSRSFSKVVAKLGRPQSYRGQLEKWSPKWRWVARAESYDAHLAEKATRAQEDAIVDMERRHASVALEVLDKLSKRLETLDPEKISARDFSALMKSAVEVERIARGKPDAEVHVKGAIEPGTVQKILEDPESTDLAAQLAARLAQAGKEQ